MRESILGQKKQHSRSGELGNLHFLSDIKILGSFASHRQKPVGKNWEPLEEGSEARRFFSEAEIGESLELVRSSSLADFFSLAIWLFFFDD